MPELYPRVESWIDWIRMEHDMQDLWTREHIFERLREQNKAGEPWSFIDGPITANNPMGVHHAWGRSLKDLYCRYWAMNGRKLRYQNGFDCQGLWVEVEVEKELGFKSKRDIAAFGLDKFVKACKERVLTFAARQTQQSIRLGQWMDWDDPALLLQLRDGLRDGTPELTVTATNGRTLTGTPEALIGKLGTAEMGGSYFTFSNENNYTIWSFLKKCHTGGHLRRGNDVMPWCCRCGTGLSQMEVAEGRKIVEHVSTYVRFPLHGRDKEALLVWTTTPWTLSSNVAAAVNPELEYLKVSHQGWTLYVSKGAYERARERNLEAGSDKKSFKLPSVEKLLKGVGEAQIVGSVKGSELVGMTYDGPYDHLPAQSLERDIGKTGRRASAIQCHRVLAWAMVSDSEGTGIVHIAPGCGAEDAELGKHEQIVAIAPLSEIGEYGEGFGELSGRHVLTVGDDIVNDLKARGVLVVRERYPHVYPHCWRCKEELVFRLVDEWFIDMGWRDRIKALVPQIRWIPGEGQARELDWLRNMGDWMISKKRFWGLALPIWVCRGCERFDIIGSEDELRARATSGWDSFAGHAPHRPHIDAVTIGCPHCGDTMDRVPDVGNPWLDAGIVPYSTLGYTTDRAHWDTWFPAQLVLECFPGQFRNWFYALLSMSAMMSDRPPFMTLLGHGLVRDEKGEEMHKSKGNAIWFDDAAEQFGADSMRWLYARQDPVQNLSFGEGPLRDVRGGFLNQLWNTHAFFVNYARLAGYSPSVAPIPFAQRPDFDRWILTELQNTIATYRSAVESFEHHLAARELERFVESLSNWYVRHNRKRFRADVADGQSAFETLDSCLGTVIRLLAPMLPFTAEKLWQNTMTGGRPETAASVHLTAMPVADSAQIDAVLAEDMRALVRYTSLAIAARDAAKLKLRQPLQRLSVGTTTEQERRALSRFAEMLTDELNVKELELHPVGTPSPLGWVVKPNFKALGAKAGDRIGEVVRAIQVHQAQLAVDLQKSDTVNVAGFDEPFRRADFLIQLVQPEGLSAAEDRGPWCAVTTEITHPLAIEGLMRDVLRRLMALRKEQGLEISDRVTIDWDSDDNDVAEAMGTWGAGLSDDLQCDRLSRVVGLDTPPLELGARTLRARMVATA